LALGASLTGLASSQAATPPSATISDASPSASWTGGPFVAPNATGNAGDPVCTVPASCDDFTLHVATPTAYGDTHRLRVTVGWTNTAADFDVYLLDAQGKTVATAASGADPETLLTAPSAGTYTVRVVPYVPAGSTFTAKASLESTPAAPAPGTETPPTFANYAAPSSFADANDAGEPSLGVDHKTGTAMFQAYLSTYKATFDDSTSPAKATWSDVSATAANGCAVGGTKSLDPIGFTDPKTGRTFESQLAGVTSLTCYTDDDGKTWHPSTGGGIPSGVDHQTIGGGPYPAGTLGTLPTSSYPHAVYYCSQDIATAFCAASHDGGTTFGNGVPTYSLMDCGGLHGHVKVAPDGTAYLPNKACGETAALVTSTDGGSSWTVHHVPGSTPGDSDPSVGVGAKGRVYFGYVGADGRPGVATSGDKGSTWADNQPLGADLGIKNAVFPTTVAGDDDRAAVAYLGTTTGGNYQDAATFKGVWHLYVSTTYDAGKTWQTSDATPTDPVQRGSICTGGTTCGNDRNLLDFIDSSVDSHGRVLVGYADGCIKSCVTTPSETSGAGPADAQAAYATIARESGGKTLFAAYDPQPNLTLTSARVSQTRTGFADVITVRNTGRAAARGFSTTVVDDGHRVRLVSHGRLAAGATTSTRVTWRAATSRGHRRVHTVVTTVDPGRHVTETREDDNRRTSRLRR
ncbi:MAG: hypothetical protein JWR20_2163, partial [Marmoricola sp.]|nr:hypothetical protein [Marmoricola sp.]